MNELTEIKNRILSRIEDFITDVKNEGLTFDERTMLDSVKEIVNEEFEKPIPEPRFIIHEDGRIEQIKTSDEKEPKYYDVFRFKKMLVKEDREKFQEFLNEHERLRAVEKQRLYDEAMMYVEVQQKLYEDGIKYSEAVCRLSQTCGVSYNEAKNMVVEMIETIKNQEQKTAKWVTAGVGIDCTGHRIKEYKCSNCGNIDLSHKKNKFCPECGRRMEG